MSIPQVLIAGDTWRIKFAQTQVDATYKLKLHINSASKPYASEEIDAAAEVEFVVAASVTTTFDPNKYSVAVIATNADGERVTLLSGHQLQVLADPVGLQAESELLRTYKAIKDLLYQRVSAEDAVYSALNWNGRALTKMSPTELLQAERAIRSLLDEEELQQGLLTGTRKRKNKIRVILS